MANASTPLIPKDGTIVITDGAALSFTVIYEDGDFQASDLKSDQMMTQVFKDRGIPSSARETERDEAIEGTFTCHAVAIVGDNTTATIGDIVLRKKVWAAYTSTAASYGDAKCVQVAWTGERTDVGATADAGITLKYCRLAGDFSEGLPAKWSIKVKAFCFGSDYVTYA